MARRGENIRKRKDGRWEARYSRSTQGMRKSCSLYAKTYTEVKEKLAAAKAEAYGQTWEMAENNNFIKAETYSEDANILFEDVFYEWLEWVQKNRKLSTYVKYCSVYHKHIQERFGNEKMTEVGRKFAEGKVSEMLGSFSESMQRSICSLVYQTGRYAAEKYGTSQACRIKRAKGRIKRPSEIFNQWELMKLLQYLHEEMDLSKMGIVLALSTGLRLGELCALRWEDIDMEMKMLHVKRTVQRIADDKNGTRLWVGEPKSRCSRREVPLSDAMWEILKKFYKETGYVFREKGPMEPRTYQNRYRKYLKAANVEYKNFHTCRHTFATNCIKSGADVKSLSEILGHSSVRITMDRYVHPAFETKRSHMNKLSFIYGQCMGQVI